MKIEVLQHASIKLSGDKVIYFDPYDIKEKINDADYIFITHDHYDHYDEESINNIKKDTTKIIVPKCLEDKENYLTQAKLWLEEITGKDDVCSNKTKNLYEKVNYKLKKLRKFD